MMVYRNEYRRTTARPSRSDGLVSSASLFALYEEMMMMKREARPRARGGGRGGVGQCLPPGRGVDSGNQLVWFGFVFQGN